MSFPDLRSFIDRLRSDNDIVTVEAPVDANLEVAEIHRRVIAAGGPALLFTNITGKDFRLVTNLFGTAKRAEIAFGERPLRLVRRVVELAETILPPTPSALWSARDVGLELFRVGMRKVPTGPVIERVTSSVQLDRLPALTCWPDDGGPFITLPLVYTQHPDRRGHNLGMYRMQVHDPRSAGMHWQIGKGGGYHYAVAEARGQPLPATVFLGGPPALILSAIAPLPENIPELVLASLHRRRASARRSTGTARIRSSRAPSSRSSARCRPHVRRPEGPFGDHYGYYSLQHDYPVFEVHRMAHRADAIFPATVVGKPRQEDFFIGDLLQDLLSPLLPARDAGRGAPLVVRRNRLSLACRGGRQAALQARGDGQRVPDPWRRAALADQVPARDRPVRGRAELQGDARARAGADAAGDRSLRVLEPLDGHARLHRTDGERGVEGRVARPG